MNAFDTWLIAAATSRKGIARDMLCAKKGHRAWRPYCKYLAKMVGMRLVVQTGQGRNAGRAIFYFMAPEKAARFA